MKLKSSLISILFFFIAAAAWGQQAAAATAPATDSGPALATTMQTLQSILNAQRKLSWATHYHDNADATDWTYALTFEAHNVVADAATCTIAYHYTIRRDGAVISDEDAAFALHDVQDLTLTTGELRQNKNDAAAGHPTWVAKVDPNVFDLIVQTNNKTEYYFFFTDEDAANRAAKAMGHTVDLCGGSRGSF